MWLAINQEVPLEEVELIFGYMIAFLQQMGLWNYVIGAIMVIVLLGLTFRLLDAIGSKG